MTEVLAVRRRRSLYILSEIPQSEMLNLRYGRILKTDGKSCTVREIRISRERGVSREKGSPRLQEGSEKGQRRFVSTRGGGGIAAPPREREGAAELVGGDDVRGVGRVLGPPPRASRDEPRPNERLLGARRGARCGGGGVQRGLVVVVASLVVVPRGVELKVAAARVGGGEELSRAQRKLVCHLGAANLHGRPPSLCSEPYRSPPVRSAPRAASESKTDLFTMGGREQRRCPHSSDGKADGRVRRVDADEPSAKGVGQPRRCGSGAALLREGGLQQPRGDEEVVRAACRQTGAVWPWRGE